MNIYWLKQGANAHWNTLTGNWWTSVLGDLSDKVQALALPTTGDFVYLRGATAPDTPPTVAVALSGFDTQGLSVAYLGSGVTDAKVSIQAGGTLIMGDPAAPGNMHCWAGETAASGTFIFNDSSSSGGTVGDYATFNDYSSSSEGTVGDYATFNDHSISSSGGTVGDYATFNDRSSNYSTVGDHVSIYSTMIQYGTWTGTTFYIGAAVNFDAEATLSGAPPLTFVLMNAAADLATFDLELGKFADKNAVVSFNQTNLAAGNIKYGIPILGVSGTLPEPMLVI
jgi:hypothetical protein